MRGTGGLVLLVLILSTIARFWWVIVAALAAAVIATVLWKLAGWLDRCLETHELRRRAAADNRAAIATRADQQHAAILAGDTLFGVHGDYPPVKS
jgi:membrane protein implicated in regulation of membrane protease activity